MQMPPHPSYFPTHSFVVNSCVSSLFLALTQGCRAITGMFLLLHSTFQQRFQVGSNSNNTCRFQSVKCDTVHVYMHVHDQIKPSPAWIFYNAKKSSCSSGAVNCFTGVLFFLLWSLGKCFLGPMAFFCNTTRGHLGNKRADRAVALYGFLLIHPWSLLLCLFLFSALFQFVSMCNPHCWWFPVVLQQRSICTEPIDMFGRDHQSDFEWRRVLLSSFKGISPELSRGCL